MKIYSSILLFTLLTFSNNTFQKNEADFTVVFEISKATKDGFYLNGYVVNIPYDKAQKLNGKKIKVIGKVTLAKGLGKKDVKDKSTSQKQGRVEDVKYILKPKIVVLE